MECCPWKQLSKSAWYGALAPRGRPKCQVRCVLGLFFRAFPFFRSPYPSILSPLTSLTFPSPMILPCPGLPLPFPKEVNKKLSYRRQYALSVVKTHQSNNDSQHILSLCLRQSRHIMLSTCLFVCPPVRPFVWYQLVNVILRKRMNQFWCKLA